MDILLAPHNDDECLFTAYTIMRHKPLVVVCTDGMNYSHKGVDFVARRRETLNAMEVLGARVLFLGLRDDCLEEADLELAIEGLKPARVFAPACYPNGHKGHNIVGKVALELWGSKVVKYATYEYPNTYILTGDIPVKPRNGKEALLKATALSKYVSQINSEAIVHFKTVANTLEYYIK
jgi:LmbE family N-acetylglucosaminyl deacetylase